MENLQPQELRLEQMLHTRICDRVNTSCTGYPPYENRIFKTIVLALITNTLISGYLELNPLGGTPIATAMSYAAIPNMHEAQIVASGVVNYFREQGNFKPEFELCGPDEKPYRLPW